MRWVEPLTPPTSATLSDYRLGSVPELRHDVLELRFDLRSRGRGFDLTGQHLVDPGVISDRRRIIEIGGYRRRPRHGATLEHGLQPGQELLRLDHFGVVVDRGDCRRVAALD